MAAGYPSWRELLKDIGQELDVNIDDIQDLTALAQWSVASTGGKGRVAKVIRDEIGDDLPIPETVRILARLPVRSFWTTNFDRLIERACEEIGRPKHAISRADDLALRAKPGHVSIYKMHGSVTEPTDVVISTDDFDLYRKERGAFIDLLRGNLTSMSMLFLGLSFSDPNLSHVFRSIRESFRDPPEHFAIVRPPQRSDFAADEEPIFEARLNQHRHWATDLKRYGLQTIEVNAWDEIPDLLREVERRVAARRVWISGSWPEGEGDHQFVADVSRAVGASVAEKYDLVSGMGLGVGAWSVQAFLEELRKRGSWGLENRLLVRPFPQNLADAQDAYRILRNDMARAAGAVVFIGGAKMDGKIIDAAGVMLEFEAAKKEGAYLLPVGSTGGTASKIAKELRGSKIPFSGPEARRPSDENLTTLETERDPQKLVKLVRSLIDRFSKAAS